jgi:hypothetical protein
MKHMKQLLMSLVLMMTALTASAQQEVSGNVVDKTGEPIIGATVMEKGTSNGVITDIDGNFKINVELGKTLVVT